MSWTKLSEAKKYAYVEIITKPKWARSYYESMISKDFKSNTTNIIESGEKEEHLTFLKEYSNEEDLNIVKDKLKYSLKALRERLKDNWTKITLKLTTGE